MTTNYRVRVSKMNGQDIRSTNYNDYETALDAYVQRCDDNNINEGDREYPAIGVEVGLSAGGPGYDYRVELVIEEEA